MARPRIVVVGSSNTDLVVDTLVGPLYPPPRSAGRDRSGTALFPRAACQVIVQVSQTFVTLRKPAWEAAPEALRPVGVHNHLTSAARGRFRSNSFKSFVFSSLRGSTRVGKEIVVSRWPGPIHDLPEEMEP